MSVANIKAPKRGSSEEASGSSAVKKKKKATTVEKWKSENDKNP